MTDQKWHKDILIWFSIALSLFSCGFDGAFLSRLMWTNAPVWGFVFGQGLNFAADAVTHVLGNQFAEEQRKAPKGSKRRKLSYLLLPADLAALYYSVAFSWYQIRLNWQDLPGWLQISAASFAPVFILWLGVARALRDANIKAEPSEAKQKASQLEPAQSEPEPLTIGFLCDVCGEPFATQQAVNAHMRKHKRTNGHKAELEREVAA